MGLNLPIRRVVFSTLRKWDGETWRHLGVAEIQQIAGRAGRYGFGDEPGLVWATDTEDVAALRSALRSVSFSLPRMGLDR